MPELMLLRHGKSSWENSGGDFERPLASRGERDVAAMAALIAAEYPPDRVLCSPSRRTRDTLAALLLLLKPEPPVSMEEDLYGADGDYLAVIARHAGDAGRLLVVGHNPAVQATALALAGSGNRGLRTRLKAKFPTGALAVIEFDRKWTDIAPRRGRLVAFRRPRDLFGSMEDDD